MDQGGHDSARQYRRLPMRPGPLPAKLMSSDLGRELAARAVDVSRRGLGVELSSPLSPGEDVWLALGHRMIKMTVRHCTPSAAVASTYRCGLAASAGWEDLQRLMEQHGGMPS